MFKFYLLKCRGHLKLTISIILLLTCLYISIEPKHITCTVHDCINLKSTLIMKMFPRTVAVACMISKITNMYNNIRAYFVYEKQIERYEFYFPLHAGQNNVRRMFIIITVSLYIIIILPINTLRLYIIFKQNAKYISIMVFTLMYVQNAYICTIELQFITRCFGLYQKFQSINEDLYALKSKSIVTNNYPSVLKPETFGCGDSVGSKIFNDDNDFPTSNNEFTLANTIELLKTRHKFVSDMISDLNNLYNIQLSLSLSVLFVMALLDMYVVLFTRINITRSHIVLLSGWLLQYSIRFCLIVLTPHATTKQAQKSKSLLTDINDRYVDTTAEEELRMFLNELSSRSMEFTTFDLFILNTRMITSALVAGTTYLIILSNFR